MDSSSRASSMIAASVVLVTLATVSLVLRFIARHKRRLPYLADDWLALTGQVLILAMFIESILWVAIGGAGKHWDNTSAHERVIFFRIFYSNQVTYIAATPIIKISVIWLYRRVFDVRNFRIVTTVLMIIIGLYFLGHLIFVTFLHCNPIRKAWEPEIPGTCVNTVNQILIYQIFNIVADVVILCLPMRMCWRLHRPWQDKAAVSVVFMVGAFVCAASIVRLQMLLKIDHSDLTYSIYDASTWTLLEPCIGQVCACLPVARGLFPAFPVNKTRILFHKTSSPSLPPPGGSQPQIQTGTPVARWIQSPTQLFIRSKYDKQNVTVVEQEEPKSPISMAESSDNDSIMTTPRPQHTSKPSTTDAKSSLPVVQETDMV